MSYWYSRSLSSPFGDIELTRRMKSGSVERLALEPQPTSVTHHISTTKVAMRPRIVRRSPLTAQRIALKRSESGPSDCRRKTKPEPREVAGAARGRAIQARGRRPPRLGGALLRNFRT